MGVALDKAERPGVQWNMRFRSAVLGPAARARLAAEQAQILAVLNLREECDDALGRAKAAAEEITESDRSGLFSDWSASRLQVYEGTCHLLLGEPRKAVAGRPVRTVGRRSVHAEVNSLIRSFE
jgi:hypothetical protein